VPELGSLKQLAKVPEFKKTETNIIKFHAVAG
jgi:hypothetical protein